MVFSQVISNEYLYKPVPPKCITELSKDSGFESRVGFTMTHWPNGKAFDYDVLLPSETMKLLAKVSVSSPPTTTQALSRLEN